MHAWLSSHSISCISPLLLKSLLLLLLTSAFSPPAFTLTTDGEAAALPHSLELHATHESFLVLLAGSAALGSVGVSVLFVVKNTALMKQGSLCSSAEH